VATLRLAFAPITLAALRPQMAELFKIAKAMGEKRANAVFFHGLGGDAKSTWQATGDQASFWPAWLAEDIQGLSVYSVGYEAPVSGWHGSAMEFTDRAANVLNLLLVKSDLAAGELILVGHSLGGLVIKQVLRKAADAATDRAEALSFIGKWLFWRPPYRGGFGGLGRPPACFSPAIGGNPFAHSQ
jgi:pimeloyl-ACP methyl ester carboxylesterase